MIHYPKSILNLIRSISKLPGIGEKTAERLALHLLKAPKSEAEALSRSILDMKERVRFCRMCFSLSDTDLCHICSDPSRDTGLICVVEQPADMVAIERSGVFKGRYHILQGVLSPMDGVGPDDIRIAPLVSKVAGGSVREVVIATGTSMEGETTASFIADRLSGHPVKVTRIASGVPVGGDLKFIDQVTLRRAMEKRHGI
jgi:recombination protein RecR